MADHRQIMGMLKRNADYNDHVGSTLGVGAGYIGGKMRKKKLSIAQCMKLVKCKKKKVVAKKRNVVAKKPRKRKAVGMKQKSIRAIKQVIKEVSMDAPHELPNLVGEIVEKVSYEAPKDVPMVVKEILKSVEKDAPEEMSEVINAVQSTEGKGFYGSGYIGGCMGCGSSGSGYIGGCSHCGCGCGSGYIGGSGYMGGFKGEKSRYARSNYKSEKTWRAAIKRHLNAKGLEKDRDEYYSRPQRISKALKEYHSKKNLHMEHMGLVEPMMHVDRCKQVKELPSLLKGYQMWVKEFRNDYRVGHNGLNPSKDHIAKAWKKFKKDCGL